MTADELASALYAEQGYLVISCVNPQEIGTIFRASLTSGPILSAKVRVLAPSCRTEHLAQALRGLQILGFAVPKAPFPERPYVYRVEAVD